MTYEAFYTGVGGTVLGTLIGAWISCRLTYGFQQRLLQQQLEFQKRQAEADTVFRRQIHDEMIGAFTEFRTMLNRRAGQVVGQMSQGISDFQPTGLDRIKSEERK